MTHQQGASLKAAAALTLMNMPNIVISDPGISGLQVNAITDAMVLRNLKEDAQ